MKTFKFLDLKFATVMSLLFVTLTGGCPPTDGSGDPDDPDSTSRVWVEPDAGDYENFDADTTATSDLGGVGLRNGEAGGTEVVGASGSLNHLTGGFSYNDGNYTFSSASGFSSGTATDGASGTVNDTSGNYAGIYDYVVPVTVSYTSGGSNYTSSGFIGVATAAENIPVSGTATYFGDATGTAISGDDFYELTNGNSQVAVNFATENVNVLLNSFTVTDGEDPATFTGLDSVNITGMTISGNTFTGGSLSTTYLGSASTPIGDDVVTNARGVFFGWDYTNDIPAEVAGVSVSEGDNGQLVFTFIAD